MYNINDIKQGIPMEIEDEHNVGNNENVMNVEDGLKRTYRQRDLCDYRQIYCYSPSKWVKLSEWFVNISMNEILELLKSSNVVIIDLTISICIDRSSQCAVIYNNSTLFVCLNKIIDSYEAMKIILSFVVGQKVMIIFNDKNILSIFASFLRKEFFLMFCGHSGKYSAACELNGICRPLLVCSHYYMLSSNFESQFDKAIKHIDLLDNKLNNVAQYMDNSFKE